MQKKMLYKKENIIRNAQKHTLKYLYDLQMHFNLNNQQLKKILKNCIIKLNTDTEKRNWWKIF